MKYIIFNCIYTFSFNIDCCRKFSPSTDNIVKKLSAEFESQTTASSPTAPTARRRQSRRRPGETSGGGRKTAVFNGGSADPPPPPSYTKETSSCDDLFPSLEPGESKLLEEQFERLAAAQEPVSADVSLSAVMEEAESVPFIDESISESTSSASATAAVAKDPAAVKSAKEVSLPLKNVCRPAQAATVVAVQATETEDVRNDLEEEIQFDPTVSSGHLGYNLDVSNSKKTSR